MALPVVLTGKSRVVSEWQLLVVAPHLAQIFSPSACLGYLDYRSHHMTFCIIFPELQYYEKITGVVNAGMAFVTTWVNVAIN